MPEELLLCLEPLLIVYHIVNLPTFSIGIGKGGGFTLSRWAQEFHRRSRLQRIVGPSGVLVTRSASSVVVAMSSPIEQPTVAVCWFV